VSQLQGESTFVQHVFARLSPPSAQSDMVTVGSGVVPPGVDPASTPIFDPLTYGARSEVEFGPTDRSATIVLDQTPGVRDGRMELVHTINGQASPGVPPLEVAQGERVALHIVNNTDEFHPMHIHGHVFTVLARWGARRGQSTAARHGAGRPASGVGRGVRRR
jgi:FtsP/CotA-like multicopper oxidase with cupredoxin domain